MVTDRIDSKWRLYNFSTVEIRLRKDEVLAKVKTINDREEVNDIVHAVPIPKHRMIVNLKYEVKQYN